MTELPAAERTRAIADEIDDASSDVRAGELREITGDIPLRDPP
jgi:hypothetical protein